MSMTRYVFTVSADKGKADCGKAVISSRITEYCELVRKNEAAIKSYLGTHRITSEIVVFPAYYGELLAWALKRYMEMEHWQTAGILGYHYSGPVYANVSTDYHETERVVVDGQLLVDSGNHRLLVTVDVRGCPRSQVRVGGSAGNKLEVKKFVDGIKAVAWKENYYRNKKLEFDGGIRFVDVFDESWGNICLEPAIKAQIKASTIGLIDKGDVWTKNGMPLKRCILLTGGADKDKTSICQALLTEAVGITCIIMNACGLDYDCAAQLYHLARDLSPCIVFIEDIDCMGQNRIKFGYHKGSALISLLTLLGNVEEHEGIVTVATASYNDALGKAIFC